MNYSKLITGLLIFLTHISFSQDFIFNWVNSAGSSARDYGHSIISDSSGSSYSGGRFQGTVDFDPGISSLNLTSNGTYDCFLQKYSPTGTLIWAKSIGGIGDDGIGSIEFDPLGNILVTGYYEGTVDFDPNSGVVSKTATSSSREIFVLKIDTAGNLIWVKTFPGSTYSAYGTDIKCDSSGNIYTCGYFNGTVDFDPGIQTFSLSSTSLWDLFIQKMDSNGNFVWAKKFGGNGFNYLGSIDIDYQGNILFTGLFANTVDFDPNIGTSNISSNGGNDAFILKLSPSGNLLWVHKFGGGANDNGEDVVTDSVGNVYVLGNFNGTVDFDPSANTSYNSANGSSDIFIVKLSPGGIFLWSKSLGGTSVDNACSMTISPNNSLVISGLFKNTVDFDPGSGIYSLTSNGDYDAFVVWLDLNGNFIDAKTMGGPGYERPDDFCFDALGNIYITGAHSQQADFDPGIDTNLLPHKGDWDIFTEKLSICYPNSGIDSISACDSYTWINGVTYTSDNNTAIDTLTNVKGCDSIVTLDLTILHASSGTDSIVACAPYTWINGVTYTTSNFTDINILTSNTGCDSVVTLNLTILPSTIGFDSVTTCRPFTWIDGNTYLTSDSASFTYSNIHGCDSILFLRLNMLQMDLNIIKSGSQFTVVESSNTTYQWLYCDSSYAPISGANSRTYTAVANGNYAVAVTKEGCTDTSSCVNINNVGFKEFQSNSDLGFYPNPTSGSIIITFSGERHLNAKVFDGLGKLVFEQTGIDQPGTKLQTNLSSGVYLLQLSDDSSRFIYPIIIR